MPCHAVLVRRSALATDRPFDESLASLEDWDLWLKLAAAGRRFLAVPAATVSYRRYEGSMSRDVVRMLASARAVLRKHRGTHLLARWSAMRAIRFGLFCDNVLPLARRTGFAAMLRMLFRHPALIEGWLLYVIFAACPPLRRRMGVLERHFRRGHTGVVDDSR